MIAKLSYFVIHFKINAKIDWGKINSVNFRQIVNQIIYAMIQNVSNF